MQVRSQWKWERRMERRILLVTLALALLLTSCTQPEALPEVGGAPATDELFSQFEGELEGLRQQLRIPGFSAAVVADGEMVWAKGFGFADLENQVAATPDTPYRLASVTKPIAATLVMQLVEEGLLDLEDPVSKYGVDLESGVEIRVWHLLTHTSEGIPGTHHDYSGDRYSYLGAVMEGATGHSFGELLSERILEPLNMTNTAPSYPECALEGLNDSPETSERVRNDLRVNRALANPYQLDPSYNIVAGVYPSGFSPAAGLISTVVDLAKFDIALDQGLLLGDAAKEKMLEPAVSTYENRDDLMYGLGWYSQRYRGTRLLWHSGRWAPSVSALYVKAPDESLTFIILANTAHLTTPFPLGDGDVLYSTLAQTFYETFVFPRQTGKSVPQFAWESGAQELVHQLEQVTDADIREVLERELWSYRQVFASTGRTELVDRLQQVHRQAYGASSVNELDLYAFRGVEYHPIAMPQVELSEAELGWFVGEYVLGDAAPAAAGALPTEVTIQMKGGKLIGVAPDAGCLSLVPLTPVRFAVPENPGLDLEFRIDGDRVAALTVQAGGVTMAAYNPVE